MSKLAANFSSAPSQQVLERAQAMGFASLILGLAPGRQAMPIASLKRIEQAIIHQTIKFYFNDNGLPVGYVIWAFLCEEAEQRILRSGRADLQPSEWQEGNSLWVIDLLAPRDSLMFILEDLRDQVFGSYQSVRYLRTKGNKAIAKQMDRNPKFGFFSAPVAVGDN